MPPPSLTPDRLWRALPAHYRDLPVDRDSDLPGRIERLRITERIAEWRRLCGKLPRHLEQFDGLRRCW
jgi:hypothetical protein